MHLAQPQEWPNGYHDLHDNLTMIQSHLLWKRLLQKLMMMAAA